MIERVISAYLSLAILISVKIQSEQDFMELDLLFCF